MNRAGCPKYGVAKETKERISKLFEDYIGRKKYVAVVRKDGTWAYQPGGWSLRGNNGSCRNQLDVKFFVEWRTAATLLRVFDGMKEVEGHKITIFKRNAKGHMVFATPADLDVKKHGDVLVYGEGSIEMITQAPDTGVDAECDGTAENAEG